MTTTKHFLGRQNDGTRVYAEITLKTERLRGRDVNHDSVDGSIGNVLSVSGFAIEKGQRAASAGGQCIDEVAKVTDPAPGWHRRDIESLLVLWRGYHLNQMNAGCIHQPNGRLGDTCPKGYRYGSKWLYRAIPSDLLDEAARLQRMPTGNVPDTY